MFQSKKSEGDSQVDPDAKLFIRNIPIDLEKEGLSNIFAKAGPIESVRIIPPKDPNHSHTYGFIDFKHATAAATAVEMFNNYKVGGKYLQVRLSLPSPPNSKSSGQQRSRSVAGNSDQSDFSSVRSKTPNSLKQSSLILDRTDDDWTDIQKNPEPSVKEANTDMPHKSDPIITDGNDLNSQMTKRQLSGRGYLLKNSNEKEQQQKRGQFNLSRPYARRLSSRYSNTTPTIETSIDPQTNGHNDSTAAKYNESKNTVFKNEKEFVIGEKYVVNLTHVTTPSNFFVQLISSVPKTANLMMNLDNYYKNEKISKIDDFCTPERGSIRCKLHNLIPANGLEQWSETARKIFEDIKNENTTEILIAKVISCEEFERKNGRFENIYGIDLLFGGQESIIQYMIDENLAIKLEKENPKTTSAEPIISGNEQKLLQEQPISEKNLDKINKPESSLKSRKLDAVQLKKDKTYRVILQYFDESLEDNIFYLSLFGKSKIEKKLQLKLQDDYETKTSPEIKYVNEISDLKLGAKLEALFDLDKNWYRGSVSSISEDQVQIYFLDYGNSVTMTASEINKKLRFRTLYKNTEEDQIFNLEYQAIKCVYTNDNKTSIEDFITKVSEVPDLEENGFVIKVKEIVEERNNDPLYHVYVTSEPCDELETEQENCLDLEVSSILEEKNKVNEFTISNIPPESINSNLELNKEHNVCICHIINTNEFYVQSPDNLRQLMDHQQKVQFLAESNLIKESNNNTNKTSHHKIGDLVFARYFMDKTWYKGLITSFVEIDNEFSYEVYFVDYGNTESEMNNSDIQSVQSIFDSIGDNKNLIEDLNSIIKFPFQAQCCQLMNKKESIRNTEILKTLMSDCLNFIIKVKDETIQKVSSIVEIKKNIVQLYSEGVLLDDSFEDEICQKENKNVEKKTEQKLVESKKLDLESVHEYKLAFFGGENEIYLNLDQDFEKLNKIQEEINGPKVTNSLEKFAPGESVKVNDIVLAKFYEEDRVSFSWYRARIITKDANKFGVFFLDYGNTDSDLLIEDLAKLPAKFGIGHHQQYSYKIQFNKVTINLEDNEQIQKLSEFFLGENFKFKVKNHLEESNEYMVELWDKEMKVCFNHEIDATYETESLIEKPGPTKTENKISMSQLDSLAYDLTSSNLCVKTKSMFIENFQKPFYFCLEDDVEKREQLKNEMNEFYKVERCDLKSFKANEYCAVLSEQEWYRAQIKKNIDCNNNPDEIILYYVDFGFEELYNKEASVVKVLDEKFLKFQRYAFGASLLDQTNTNIIQLEIDDDVRFAAVFEEFFASGLNEFDVKVCTKFTEKISDQYVNDENYYGIVMYNGEGLSLNEMISKAKEEKVKIVQKKQRPNLIELKYSDLPSQPIDKQVADGDRFMLFARHIDLFYIFEENRVKLIQEEVQEVCHHLIEEQQKLVIVPGQDDNLFNKGDLVFGKYEDDQAWYRCMITNCTKNRSKFELFYIDFGNTEIATKEDILYGWNDTHISVFKSYEAQAFKCKLYGLLPNCPNEFNESENLAFKKHISDKTFKVKLLKYNKLDKNYEVTLNDPENDNASVHDYLTLNNLAKYNQLDTILKQLKSKDEAEFYIGLIKKLNLQIREFS